MDSDFAASSSTSFPNSQVLFDEPMQSLTVAGREFKSALISGDDHDLAQGVMQDAASVARLEVISDRGSKAAINVVVDKV
jgi:hypothetical protein